MNKKFLLVTLPAIMVLAGCGPSGGTPDPKPNPELEKFNEIVSNIKTNHNYQLHISSRLEGEEFDEDAIIYDRFYLNDKAWYLEYNDVPGLYQGIIYQKDQGYVQFMQSGTNLVPTDLKSDFEHEEDPSIFDSTNPNKTISQLYEIIGENLFLDGYTQDSTDKTKFVTIGMNNIAIAAHMTQYAAYIGYTFSVDSSMTAILDVTNNQIKLSLNYWLAYFDEEEKEAPGKIDITVTNVGGVVNETASSYVENPTTIFTKPTSWPEGSSALFEKHFKNVTPVLPNALSFAAVFDEMIYDGYYYAGWIDYACGDIRSAYGTQLLGDGYTKVNDNLYQKLISDPQDELIKITYQIRMVYSEGDDFNPNGYMRILYRANMSQGAFDTIDDLNSYLTKKKYNELVPLLPQCELCTGVTNFKDQTSGETYALKVNSTDTFKVAIADYATAKAWVDSYVELLSAKGYTDESKFLSMTNYGFEDSTSGTYVGLDFPSSAGSYSGKVGLRFVVTTDDANELRTRGAVLTDIEISGYTTTYKVGDTFNFDGTCTAHYENGASKVVTPTQVSSPDMTTIGEKTVTVSYTQGSVTKSKEYTITVNESKVLTKIELGGVYNIKFAQNSTFNHTGMSVKAIFDDGSSEYVSSEATFSGYNMSQLGLQTVKVSYTHGAVTKTAEYQIYVAETLTWPALSITGDKVDGWFTDLGEYDIEVWNFNNTRSFLMVCGVMEAGVTIKGASVVGDSDAVVELIDDDYYGMGLYQYLITPTINFTATSLTINVETEGVQPTAYNLSKTSGMEEGRIVLVSPSTAGEVEVGTEVKFKVEAYEGYEIDEIFIKDHKGEVTIQTREEGFPVPKTVYYFNMPAFDCEITATFNSVAPEKDWYVSVDSGEHGSISLNPVYYNTGEKVTFTVTPDSGYEIESVDVSEDVQLYDEGSGVYSFDMPASDVIVSATFTEQQTPTTYNVSKTSGMEEGRIVLVSPSTAGEVEVGTEVKFKVEAYDGYEIDEVFIKDHKGEVTIQTREEGFPVPKTVYYFNMPAFDCEITATFTAVQPTLTSITLRGTYQTEFNINETFNYEGLIVDAHYSDDTTDEGVTGFTVSTPDMTTAGDKTVTVSYTDEAGTTASEKYTITVKGGEPVPGFIGGKYTLSGVADLYLEFNSDFTGKYYFGGNIINFTWSVNDKTITIIPESDYDEDNFGSRKIFFGKDSITVTLNDDFSKLTVKMGSMESFASNKTMDISL